MCLPVNIGSVGKVTGRPTYHHGDLRNALIRAGAALAEEGGPEQVGVRAAARRVGVSPTAAYRHFSGGDELLGAVKDQAIHALSSAVEAEVTAAGEGGGEAEAAVQRLRAIGRGYVQFALAEPGLFRTAFGQGGGTVPVDLVADQGSAFALLSGVLDELVAAGWLPQERRPLAELAAWSAVHGLARLLLDGPLAGLPEQVREAAVERTLTMISRGL